jgi:hypothetical protein
MIKRNSYFKPYGLDEIGGRINMPLKKFRGMFTAQITIDEIKADEESYVKADKIKIRDEFLSRTGIIKL